MTAGNQANEPSMEEILASIRRIISENDEVTGLKEESSGNQNVGGVESEGLPTINSETVINDEDVLVLSCELQDDGTVKDLNTGEIKTPRGISDVTPRVDSTPSSASVPASVTSFSAIASIVDDQSRGHGTVIENKTLERIVKEVARPMIRKWLDDNLPELVERVVNKEIKQVMRDADELSRT